MILDDIDTPAVLIDLDIVAANLSRAQDYATQHGLRLRPHVKTHKLPRFAQDQMALGAVGITAQKLGEAEVMADAGLTDILITYNIIGPAKLARLGALHDRTTLTVCADSATTVAGYAEVFGNPTRPLTVLVECDTGAGRCGVQTPADAVTLARQIAAAPGLRFGGLMTYPPQADPVPVAQWLAQARALLLAAGLDPAIISTGGTPGLHRAHLIHTATELRPGTYIYNDRMQIAAGAATVADCALTVLTTVVSRPTATRAILDAGSKALSSDLYGLTGHGIVPALPDSLITALSEEHGTLTGPDAPAVGTRLRILPNHACVVTNLFDRVHLIRGARVIAVEPVAARGRMT